MNSTQTPAFAANALPLSLSSFAPTSTCASRTTPSSTPSRRTTVRMDASKQLIEPSAATGSSAPAPAPAPSTWPPADMTEEWAEAVQRLSSSISGVSLDAADEALQAADGDEMLALRYLTEDNRSEIQKQRERVVEQARAAGDLSRISAVKEAELRRKATGSARDFFKGFVETEGRYVDAGYVDESADAMGKMMDTVKGWFGNK